MLGADANGLDVAIDLKEIQSVNDDECGLIDSTHSRSDSDAPQSDNISKKSVWVASIRCEKSLTKLDLCYLPVFIGR